MVRERFDRERLPETAITLIEIIYLEILGATVGSLIGVTIGWALGDPMAGLRRGAQVGTVGPLVLLFAAMGFYDMRVRWNRFRDGR